MISLALAMIAADIPLWKNIEAGMTVEQVRELYPEQKGKRPDGKKLQVEHNEKNTELHGFIDVGKCRPRVEIMHPNGKVTEVVIWMQARGAFSPMCADDARSMALTKFGTPLTRDDDHTYEVIGGQVEQEELTWVVDGVTVTFEHESYKDRWSLTYSAAPAGEDSAF